MKTRALLMMTTYRKHLQMAMQRTPSQDSLEHGGIKCLERYHRPREVVDEHARALIESNPRKEGDGKNSDDFTLPGLDISGLLGTLDTNRFCLSDQCPSTQVGQANQCTSTSGKADRMSWTLLKWMIGFEKKEVP